VTEHPATSSFDVVLIGAGIMSATFATFLNELAPSLSIGLYEALDDCAQESSDGWNNAGTGHAANCEMNYTPQRLDGSVDIAKALEVNTEFDISRQFWAHLVQKGALPDPRAFLHPCPHMSFVWGADNVAFLRARYQAMAAHHCFHGMEYTEDHATIAAWAPLIMDGRDSSQPLAATRMASGTDVDFGALTHLLFKNLRGQPGFSIHYQRRVVGLDREPDQRWRVEVEDSASKRRTAVHARFVFIGAGGGALTLLQKSQIPEARGYGGFPVSGIWLRCDVDSISARHNAKVYGKAATGSPPMSVPHLDTRHIGGNRSLLFGPYAGFTTKFLKHGSPADLFTSVTHDNIIPLLDVARDNLELTEYLIGQVMQSAEHQFSALQEFFPHASRADWKKAVAGQRVQTIAPHPGHGWFKHGGGTLEFGTELVAAADKSIVALLGASPGASTAAYIALEVLQRCFDTLLADSACQARLAAMIPTLGIDLKRDADACRRTRAATAAVLAIADA
jgi:malate dehydrogenase (quinone)